MPGAAYSRRTPAISEKAWSICPRSHAACITAAATVPLSLGGAASAAACLTATATLPLWLGHGGSAIARLAAMECVALNGTRACGGPTESA